MNKKRIYAIILLPLIMPLFMIGFLSAQVDTSILTMQGKDWSVRVDQNLQTETVLSQPYAVVSKQGQEKELFLQINDIKECASGIVEFKVAVSGLTFYKQLPLDQELKLDEKIAFLNATHALDKEGNILTYRSLNVVNSFAGFDSQGRKQLHVYASKIVDVKGVEVWLDQDLANGLLTVYLPDLQTLEGLSFPLVLDPTFGKTDIGATSDWFNADYLQGTLFDLSDDNATITSISLYKGSGGDVTGDFKVGAYDSDRNLLGEGSGTFGANGWQTVTITGATETDSDTVWLVFISDVGDSSGSGSGRYDASSNSAYFYAQVYGDAMPDPLPIDGISGTKDWSIYANYTTGVSPTPTPTPTPTASPSPVSQETDSTLNLVILLCSLILGLLLIVWHRVPVVNLVFGMFMIGIAAYTLIINLYAGGLLQLAVIIIGALCMYSGYREAM